MERVGFAAGKKHGTAIYREPHLFSDPPAARKGLIIQFFKWGRRQTLHGRFYLSCPGGGKIRDLVCAESFPFCSKSGYHQDRKIPASLFEAEQKYQLIFFEGRHLGEKNICNR